MPVEAHWCGHWWPFGCWWTEGPGFQLKNTATNGRFWWNSSSLAEKPFSGRRDDDCHHLWRDRTAGSWQFQGRQATTARWAKKVNSSVGRQKHLQNGPIKKLSNHEKSWVRPFGFMRYILFAEFWEHGHVYFSMELGRPNKFFFNASELIWDRPNICGSHVLRPMCRTPDPMVCLRQKQHGSRPFFEFQACQPLWDGLKPLPLL